MNSNVDVHQTGDRQVTVEGREMTALQPKREVIRYFLQQATVGDGVLDVRLVRPRRQ